MILIAGFIGWMVGNIKSFRDEKLKAYGEIFPPILKMAFNPKDTIDEKEYSKALANLWLYGSKKVTRKVEKALLIMHDPKKGNLMESLQNAVVEMRSDIQIFPWEDLNPEDVNHLYSTVPGKTKKP